MGMFGILPNMHTLNILIDCFSRLNRMDYRLFVDGKLFKLGYEWDVVMLDTLIKGFCLNSKFVEALRCFYRMKKGGFEPNILIYCTILNALCKMGKTSTAIQWFWEMDIRICGPDIVAYSMVIDY